MTKETVQYTKRYCDTQSALPTTSTSTRRIGCVYGQWEFIVPILAQEPYGSRPGRWTGLRWQELELDSKQRRANTRRSAWVAATCHDPSLIVGAEVRLSLISYSGLFNVCLYALLYALFCRSLHQTKR